VTGNQSSKLLKMTEKTGFLRISGEPVIIREKEKNPAFQIRLGNFFLKHHPSQNQTVGDIEKRFFVSDSPENFNRREIFSISDSDRLTGNH
jgi:hypothetical protein